MTDTPNEQGQKVYSISNLVGTSQINYFYVTKINDKSYWASNQVRSRRRSRFTDYLSVYLTFEDAKQAQLRNLLKEKESLERKLESLNKKIKMTEDLTEGEIELDNYK